jgi:hypothetical protein
MGLRPAAGQTSHRRFQAPGQALDRPVDRLAADAGHPAARRQYGCMTEAAEPKPEPDSDAPAFAGHHDPTIKDVENAFATVTDVEGDVA